MHECEHLMPDDYVCGDVAVVRVGRKWLCDDHAHEAKTGDEADTFDFENEEEDEVLPYEE